MTIQQLINFPKNSWQSSTSRKKWLAKLSFCFDVCRYVSGINWRPSIPSLVCWDAETCCVMSDSNKGHTLLSRFTEHTNFGSRDKGINGLADINVTSLHIFQRSHVPLTTLLRPPTILGGTDFCCYFLGWRGDGKVYVFWLESEVVYQIVQGLHLVSMRGLVHASR